MAREYGTPVFLALDEDFRENCRTFQRYFRCGRRRVVHAYSYKTNNIKALCKAAHQEGLAAEVVSAAELNMALSLGLDGRQIYYNGPFKPLDSIEMAILRSAAIHVDSLTELENVATTADDLGKPARIGLRLTPIVGDRDGLVWGKFGLSLDEGEVDAALSRIQSSTQIHLEGLHMHIGTNLTDSDLYEKSAECMADAIDMVQQRLNRNLQYIDIGGGFSAASGATPFTAHTEEWQPISVDEVGKRVDSVLNRVDPDQRLNVVTEPGRILAEASMALLCRVVSVKMRQGRRQIVLDAGTNLLPTAYYTRHPLSFPSRDDETLGGAADFHGPICTQYDLMAAEVSAPSLSPGDLVLIHAAGAYTYTFSCQFVGPRPPVVLIQSGHTVSLVREREPDNILWQYDHLPTDGQKS
ncbi:MAG: alanine racemase [Verrucomicrobia bacterium]|nr:alanine racemase [Verrucomicrobiota bacterium]